MCALVRHCTSPFITLLHTHPKTPGLIFGPLLSKHHASAFSIQLFTQLVTGILPPVKLPWAVVDIRDVAAAHVAALNPEVTQGRYLLTSGTLSLREIIDQVSRWGGVADGGAVGLIGPSSHCPLT